MTDFAKAVFLSYASQDAEAARKISESLCSAGIEVWFDQSELVGGDAWDAKIRKQIRECALFVPVISANTQARGEGYFRLEWKLAAERTHLLADDNPFLVPVAVDGTTETSARVPAEFLKVQWSRLPGGNVKAGFVEQVKNLLGWSALSSTRSLNERVGDNACHLRKSSRRFAIYPALLGALALSIVAAVWYSRRQETPIPSDKSIAVLPFVNASDDKENTALLSDGVQEDILTNLANIREFRVISRTSVEQYRDTKKPIPQIAQELGVAYVLEGSVRRAGNQVHVTGELIRAGNEDHVWGRGYDRDLSAAGIFGIQAQLAQDIAAALKTVLSPAEKSLVERRPTENLASYEIYLKWRKMYQTTTDTAPALQKEKEMLQESVKLDPNFAEAWGAIAFLDSQIYSRNWDRTDGRLAMARNAIETAARLAPDSPEVIRRLGDYYFFGVGDWSRAADQYEKTIRLQPNYADGYMALGLLQRRQGKRIEAVASLRRAIELDPANPEPGDYLSNVLMDGRRYAEAIAEWRRTLERTRVAGSNANDVAEWEYTLATLHYRATGSTLELESFLAGLPVEMASLPAAREWRATLAEFKGDFSEPPASPNLEALAASPSGDFGAAGLLAAQRLAARGDMAAARAYLEGYPARLKERLLREPNNASVLITLGRIEAVLGEKEEAIRHAQLAIAIELQDKSVSGFDRPLYRYYLALVHAWNGDKDRAVAEIEQLLRVPKGAPSVHIMRTAAETFPLHGDPRFEALLNDPKNNAPLF